MRPGLVSYFDIGQSFGLGDSAFLPEALAPELDLSLIGWTNPLGRGVALDLLRDAHEVVDLWQESARDQLRRPAFESGWVPESGIDLDDFLDRVENAVATHGIRICALRIFALGTVLTRLELESGLRDDCIEGVLRCFEFAAYTVRVSDALRTAALQRALTAARSGAERLRAMTQRNDPVVTQDSPGMPSRGSSPASPISCSVSTRATGPRSQR